MPLTYFPVIALSINYEMDYVGVVALLRSAGIDPRAAAREEGDPLVIAGGPAVSANPEPLAPILDAIVIGEAEPILPQLTEALRLAPDGRDMALQALSRVPGIYVPSLHPVQLDSTYMVDRLWLGDLDRFPTYSSIVTPQAELANMGLIEIARGCGRGCRFCLAGHAFLPPRQRSVDCIVESARELLTMTPRLGLVSAAVSDHGQIDPLVDELLRLGARLSASSMRVDPVSESLLRALARSGTRTLTIAPEAGTERLRRVIHKTQTEEDVLRAVSLAASLGIEQVKLYFMLGLPTEEEADLQGMVDLTLACAERSPRPPIVAITPFVPKAHTPYQRFAQVPASIVRERLSYVERRLSRHGVPVKSESPDLAEVQGILARGDRRLAPVLLEAERLTARDWSRSLASAGLTAGEFLRARKGSEALPWSFIRPAGGSTRQPGPQAPGDPLEQPSAQPCPGSLEDACDW